MFVAGMYFNCLSNNIVPLCVQACVCVCVIVWSIGACVPARMREWQDCYLRHHKWMCALIEDAPRCHCLCLPQTYICMKHACMCVCEGWRWWWWWWGGLLITRFLSWICMLHPLLWDWLKHITGTDKWQRPEKWRWWRCLGGDMKGLCLRYDNTCV